MNKPNIQYLENEGDLELLTKGDAVMAIFRDFTGPLAFLEGGQKVISLLRRDGPTRILQYYLFKNQVGVVNGLISPKTKEKTYLVSEITEGKPVFGDYNQALNNAGIFT